MAKPTPKKPPPRPIQVGAPPPPARVAPTCPNCGFPPVATDRVPACDCRPSERAESARPGLGKYDPGEVSRFTGGITALLGGPLNNSDAQDLTAIAVRMPAHDRRRLLEILTTNAEG